MITRKILGRLSAFTVDVLHESREMSGSVTFHGAPTGARLEVTHNFTVAELHQLRGDDGELPLFEIEVIIRPATGRAP